ncbi:MAG TPA: GyrI-like domain-containing protein [Bacillota bacterium]|jgi:predicted transcriptional regulator YdeE|nr:GyrI-like domain-containing protein [Bacillota bacterium]
MNYVIKEMKTRYFAGIEFIGGIKVDSDDYNKIPNLWTDFKKLYLKDIPDKVVPNNFIGLEMYRFDFMESRTLDYFALVEINNLYEPKDEEIITKKLPKGRYISFTISHDELNSEVEKVYQFIKEKRINVHLGFDVKEYLVNENYDFEGAKLLLTFKLED